MTNFSKKQFIVAAMFTVLAVAVTSLMNSRQVAAQGPPDGLAVNIVNPLPVPVSGKVEVGNFPSPLQVTGTVQVANQQEPVRLRGACTVDGACGLVDFTVPMGKRLVIEYVSALISGQPASGFGVITIQLLRTNPPFPQRF